MIISYDPTSPHYNDDEFVDCDVYLNSIPQPDFLEGDDEAGWIKVRRLGGPIKLRYGQVKFVIHERSESEVYPARLTGTRPIPEPSSQVIYYPFIEWGLPLGEHTYVREVIATND